MPGIHHLGVPIWMWIRCHFQTHLSLYGLRFIYVVQSCKVYGLPYEYVLHSNSIEITHRMFHSMWGVAQNFLPGYKYQHKMGLHAIHTSFLTLSLSLSYHIYTYDRQFNFLTKRLFICFSDCHSFILVHYRSRCVFIPFLPCIYNKLYTPCPCVVCTV